MKKILILLLSLTVLLSLTSCGDEIKEETKKYYSTGSVFSGSINLENSYVGYIEGKETVQLSTKVGGRVTELYVKEGDYVEKGVLLAKLDSLEAKVGYSTAKNIIDTLLSMKKSTSEMFDEQINSMQAKVEQVKLGEEGIKGGLEDTISITNAQLETAKTGVETAKANLDHTKIILDTKEIHIYDNSKDAIVGAMILYTNIIKFVDILLGFTPENRDKNDVYEDYLSAKNSSYLKEAEAKFLETNKMYLEYKSFYENEIDGITPSKEIILKGLNDGEELAEKLKSLLSTTYDVLDNSIENYYFSLETIGNYKNQISTFGNNIESSLLTVSGEYILGLKGSRQGLDDFEKAYSMQIDLLEKQLLLAENTLVQYQAMSEGQVREVYTKVKVTSSQLDEIKSGLSALRKQKETSLNEIQAKINEAIGQRNSAGVMINNGEIRSPIAGIITSKMVEVGQVIGGGIPILTVSNNKSLELNITVSEELSNNINLFDSVLLEIEGLDKQVIGKITNILPSKDLVTKKIGVEISVASSLLEGEIERGIKIGSFTKVIFNNTSENNGIIISNSAIISKFMIPGVYVLENGIVKFKNIEILKQNDSFSEVRGVSVGEIIIIEGKENIWDGEELR